MTNSCSNFLILGVQFTFSFLYWLSEELIGFCCRGNILSAYRSCNACEVAIFIYLFIYYVIRTEYTNIKT